MQKPVILLINRVYPPQRGATGRLLQDLARRFAEEGWAVTILTTGFKTETRNEEFATVRRIKVSDRKTMLNYALIWIRLYFGALKIAKPDLVITMTDPPLLVLMGRMLAAKWKIPHINWCQDLYPDLLHFLGVRLPGFCHRLLNRVSRRSMKSCDHVVVIGRCMFKYLAQTGMDTRGMIFIPNWPDRELRGPVVKPDLMQARPPKPLLTDTIRKFRVLYAGTLGLIHPVETILDAAAILHLSNPEIEFVFVGEGPGHEKMIAERSKRGLENIRLLPFQPAFQLAEMMQGGDLHLISMKDDVSGMAVPSKIYSAFASERPAIFIGPHESEAAKVLTKYGAGSVLPQGQARALADEVIAYRMDGNKWFEAHKGAIRANERFAPENSTLRWIESVRSLLGYPKA